MNGNTVQCYFFVMRLRRPRDNPAKPPAQRLTCRIGCPKGPQAGGNNAWLDIEFEEQSRKIRSRAYTQRSAACAYARRLPLRSEEHEPDDAQDQDPKPGRNHQQRQHRRAGFGLTRLGRGFDNLTRRCLAMGIRCLSACNASECFDTACPKQRPIGNDVPDIWAMAGCRGVQKVAVRRQERILRRLTPLLDFLLSPCLRRGP